MMRLIYLAYQIYCFFIRPVTLGVRVVLIRDNQVLLVRQTYVPSWFVRGGGVKRGETLEGAARREIREEVGAEIRSLSLMGAYSHFSDWKSDHNIVFISHDFTIHAKKDREIAEARFFPLDNLPKTLYSGHRRRLEEYRAEVKRSQGDALNLSRGAAGFSPFGDW